ncbi:MAG: ribose-5-phosphate isomerase RpiA [Gemmataceae bacterium]
MKFIERALDLVAGQSVIGLGSGRAAQMFVRSLGEFVKAGKAKVRGIATSLETAALATQVGIPLVTLADVSEIDVTFDGADEVDRNLNLIKGYGRAMVREKIVAAASRRLVILVGKEKLVPQLGSRGKLPIEIVPFGLPLCERRLRQLGCNPLAYRVNGSLFTTDNGNHILDCEIGPIANPLQFENDICAIPGVVGTGLFLGMADVVLVSDSDGENLVEERNKVLSP